MSGASRHAAVQPPGPADSVWVSSMTSSVPAERVSVADPLEVAGLRQDDAHVGQRRLHQDGGHVAVGELPLELLEVVVLGHPARVGHVDGRADVPRPRRGAVGPADDERLVDGAVVAPAVEQDLRSSGHGAAEPDGPAVGVGGGEGEAPARHTEASGQLRGDGARVLGGQHRRRAAEVGVAGGHRGDRRRRRVPGHRPRVAEAEVDELVPVEIGDPGAARPVEVQREATGRLRHPCHRDAVEQVRRGRGRAGATAGCARRTCAARRPAGRTAVPDRSRRSSLPRRTTRPVRVRYARNPGRRAWTNSSRRGHRRSRRSRSCGPGCGASRSRCP